VKRPEKKESYKVCSRCNRLLKHSEFATGQGYDFSKSYCYQGDICTKCIIEGRT
jgi:hypothetical protein